MFFNKKSSGDNQYRFANLNIVIIAIIVLIGIILGFTFVLIIGTSKNILNLPPPKQATIFYDGNNREFTRIYIENRIEMPLQKVPALLKKAIINVEDNRFYEHSGIDIKAIFRAMWVDLKGGGYIEGASTITQQLARNVLLTQKRTMARKIQEAFLAMSIERNYTKDEILERYLNQICFGHGAYGVEAASRLFFGKSVTELQIHQMALLAGLPKNPTGYSPYLHPQAAKERREIILEQMAKYGTITPAEAAFYNQKPLDVIPLSAAKRRAAYFVDYVVQRLKGIINEEALYVGGYQIYTTLDPAVQDAAEMAVASLTGGKPDALKVLQPQMALVAIDPRTGYIKAMIGGRDYANTQLNRAASARRQPGSTMKPFVYTAAMDSRQFTPSTIMVDEEVKYQTPQGEYAPQNYDKIFRGEISLRQALEQSINIIAIKLVENLGPSRVLNYAKKMGLKNLVVTGVNSDLNFSALALGGLTNGVTPLELTGAYTPLANKGIYVEPIAVLEVKDADGNTIYEDHPHKQVAIPEATAYLMTDMLRGVIMRGTGRAAMIDRPAAGKTGTTSDYTNAWFVGYTPDLLASVWIGNDIQRNPVTINGAAIGSAKAAEIWGIFMRKALAQTPPSDFVPPAGIVSGIEVCTQSGELATANCPETKYETYLAGTEPTTPCHIHQNGPAGTASPDGIPNGTGNQSTAAKNQKMVIAKICTESGLLATPYCPADKVNTEIFPEGQEPTASCNIHKGP
ncbi:MAG: transglycosylase domain-containing protein [Bacillota bacterium]